MESTDRRQDNPNIIPLRERRQQPEPRRVPRWIEWTRANEQRGAKDLTGRQAA